jgi:hypothetical protein
VVRPPMNWLNRKDGDTACQSLTMTAPLGQARTARMRL